MGRKCCVSGCTTGYKEKGHGIPSNPALRVQWLHLAGRPDLRYVEKKELSKWSICHRHFPRSALAMDFQRDCLKQGTLPTLNLPQLVPVDDTEINQNNLDCPQYSSHHFTDHPYSLLEQPIENKGDVTTLKQIWMGFSEEDKDGIPNLEIPIEQFVSTETVDIIKDADENANKNPDEKSTPTRGKLSLLGSTCRVKNLRTDTERRLYEMLKKTKKENSQLKSTLKKERVKRYRLYEKLKNQNPRVPLHTKTSISESGEERTYYLTES